MDGGTEVSGTALGLGGASNGTCTGTGRGHSINTAALAVQGANALITVNHTISVL